MDPGAIGGLPFRFHLGHTVATHYLCLVILLLPLALLVLI